MVPQLFYAQCLPKLLVVMLLLPQPRPVRSLGTQMCPSWLTPSASARCCVVLKLLLP